MLGEGGERQCCLAHLLREIADVDTGELPHKPPDRAQEWNAFVKMMRRLLREGIRLRERRDFTPESYASRITRIDQRLIALTEASNQDTDVSRLASRLSRHRDELFMFLDRPEASGETNFAERQIRLAVILRKNSQCNRSESGAATQAVLMSVYRTLKLRGLDPRAAIRQALRIWSETGSLPPLPPMPLQGDDELRVLIGESAGKSSNERGLAMGAVLMRGPSMGDSLEGRRLSGGARDGRRRLGVPSTPCHLTVRMRGR